MGFIITTCAEWSHKIFITYFKKWCVINKMYISIFLNSIIITVVDTMIHYG